MADIQRIKRIKPGDRLRIEGVVSAVDPSAGIHDQPVRIQIANEETALSSLWLNWAALQAAEHIPAPKTFKRGDPVRHIANRMWTDGIVLYPGVRDYAVHFAGTGIVETSADSIEAIE